MSCNPYTAKLSPAFLRRFRAIVVRGMWKISRISPVPRVYGGSEVLIAWWFCRNSISAKFPTAAYPPDAHPCADSPLLFAILASSPCGNVLLLLLLLVQPSLVVLVTARGFIASRCSPSMLFFAIQDKYWGEWGIFIAFFKRGREFYQMFCKGFAGRSENENVEILRLLLGEKLASWAKIDLRTYSLSLSFLSNETIDCIKLKDSIKLQNL